MSGPVAKRPRLIVEVRWGPMNGRKVTIDPGASLSVGRTDLADLVIAHDKHLSGQHFSLEWDGKRATLRDLDSMEGTLLDGEPVKSANVGHGAWIRAGETDLSVYIEDKVPPPEDEEEPPEDEDSRLDAARSALRQLREEAEREPLFAILDAARDDRILELLRQSVEPHQSLYEGIQGEPMATVAPYLTGPFRSDSVLLDRLVMEGWGRRWGIYVTSQQPFKEVRRHFRRFLMVELEDTSAPVYFRFYDPWVMKTFWSVVTPLQAGDLLRPIGALLVEGDGRRLVRMTTAERQDGATLT